MRYSKSFIRTLKEVPSDAQVMSHIFLVRAGYIRQLAAGIYNFMPLGWKVIRKIEDIVREELDRAGAQEVLLPASTPAELWQETGRWSKYGPELLRFKDRKGADFCFGPTHEEVITDMVRREVKSYRELPINLYQIQGKFRDEMRPRAGLMRGREFIMKDAYSFDVSEDAARISYQSMYDAYCRIFRRCGLDFRTVEADSGAIGGSMSHEFQVLAETGEDALVACDSCDYAANVEQAELAKSNTPGIAGTGADLAEVATPGAGTIEQVAAFLKVSPDQIIKTLIYMADGSPVAVLVRGDRAVNEIKVKRLLGATELFLARDGQVKKATGAPSGYAGPVALTIPTYADVELVAATGAVVGANKADAHMVGFDIARDGASIEFAELRLAQVGDACGRCTDGRYRVFRGIEVGHVFQLGTVYTEPMGCTYLDETGVSQLMEMGCYGIGITRVAASAIEQNHDDGGIIWPMSIAPFQVTILSLGKEDAVAEAAEALYQQLLDQGIEVLFDDREERPGGKFKDADLIGIPLRVAVGGRSLKEGVVEVKWRRESEATKVPVSEAGDRVVAMVREELAGLRNGASA